MNNKTQIKNLYLKSAIFFIPVFIIFYGVNPYGINTIFLYNNPFGTLATEQWLQESPIQFFLGYFLNIFLGNEQSTFNFVNIIGFIFISYSLTFLLIIISSPLQHSVYGGEQWSSALTEGLAIYNPYDESQTRSILQIVLSIVPLTILMVSKKDKI